MLGIADHVDPLAGLVGGVPRVRVGEAVGDPGKADAVASRDARCGNQPAVDGDGHSQENADPPVVRAEERPPGCYRFEPPADLCRHDPLSSDVRTRIRIAPSRRLA